MFSPEMENLIQATLQDGVLTDQEKAVLIKRALKEGIDVDELDVYIQSLMQKRHQAEATEAAEEDRKSKMGDLKRCPNCGAVVQPGWAACPSCGIAFNQTDNSSAYEKFYSELSNKNFGQQLWWNTAVKKFEDKAYFIQNYPVPNSRIDLLEFLTNLRPLSNISGSPTLTAKQNKTGNFDFSYYYWKLFQNCIVKARRSFSSDPDFLQFYDFEQKELAKNNKEEKKGFFAKLFGK